MDINVVSAELKLSLEICLFIKPMLLTAVTKVCQLPGKVELANLGYFYVVGGKAGGIGDSDLGRRSCQVFD